MATHDEILDELRDKQEAAEALRIEIAVLTNSLNMNEEDQFVVPGQKIVLGGEIGYINTDGPIIIWRGNPSPSPGSGGRLYFKSRTRGGILAEFNTRFPGGRP